MQLIKKNSIVSQIIVVDNCSNDNSYIKLKELEDNNIVVIKTDKNGDLKDLELLGNAKATYTQTYNNTVAINTDRVRELWIASGKDPDEINNMSDLEIKKLTYKKMVYPLVNAKFLDAIEGMSMEVEMY